MPLPDLDPSRAPELLFGDILEYIDAAEASVNSRDMVVLAGLDTAVDALCKRVVAMELDAAKEYAPELAHMMERLDQLQKKMTALQNEVSTTVKSLNSTKKANNAYNNAPTGKTED